MQLEVVVLAAGQGTRMNSTIPKVLHELAGKPLLLHVLEVVAALLPYKVHVVHGQAGEQFQQAVAKHETLPDINWVQQSEQLGTGHAVTQALSDILDSSWVLILYADVPLTQLETLQLLLAKVDDTKTMALLTVQLQDPFGYGRILRDEQNEICGIVEEKDASSTQKQITEVNTGIFLVPAYILKQWLPNLSNENAQKEYYLTDIVTMAVAAGWSVNTVSPKSFWEVSGVNNRLQLTTLERYLQQQLVQQLLIQGASVADLNRLDIRGEVTVGKDVWIDTNVILEGTVQLGDQVHIGANCVLKNVSLAAGVRVLPFSYIDGATVAANCVIGPYARIRPGTKLDAEARIGNFVEVKNTKIGRGSKVNHLSYVGDSQLGQKVNVGAGTITCNYDGVNKHKTVMQDNCFIGSNTALVAPVTVSAGATIGAGSVISKDAPADQLTLTRSKQYTVSNWRRPTKKE